jgi:hypothetical protein
MLNIASEKSSLFSSRNELPIFFRITLSSLCLQAPSLRPLKLLIFLLLLQLKVFDIFPHNVMRLVTAFNVSVVSINCVASQGYIFHNQLKFVQQRVQEEEEDRKYSTLLAENKSPSEKGLVFTPSKTESLIPHISTPAPISVEQNHYVFFKRNTQSVRMSAP